MMNIQDFCELLQIELKEEHPITPETHFKELENYGSLSAVIVLQLVEDHFKVAINPRGFRSMQTVNDMVQIIGEDKFS